ncbi:hypothetical protein LOTGIDRAFT_190753 [Lottia gigantea]|uniref:Nuclear cap-binding protein subunit 1 n=1 Tax=Lottia gigantea TaxID=225164 RepID=V4AG41_LOTGI|nr:hypothetical protein LOTGIDRAFT_190753 [Lottia gigantea]ESO92366.1 hypothetical protein LOTGIDRAFT_190753 [Lottia gigantea]
MSRRRRESYSDDEDDSSRHKRRRTSDDVNIEDRLDSLITRVGEKSTSSLESNLEGLASVLEADLPNYKDKIIKILCDCVIYLPEKITVYTTLVGLLNAKNYNCGGEFTELIVRNLKDYLKTGKFEDARMTVRFIADLVNCHVLVAGSVLQMFDNLIEVTLEDNIPQVRSDFYVYAVLSALPYVGRELFEKKEQELNKLLQTIENYISKRHHIHVPSLRVWSSDDPHPQEEYLDCLWAQIKNLRNNKWMEKQISRPYNAFDSVLCDALQHTLPQIIPPSHNDEIKYPLPMVVFRIFDYTDVPEGTVLPGSHAIERYLIEEHLQKIIDSNFLERKECAAALLSFPTKNKLPLNYIIIETLFAELFNLPKERHLELFYGVLLIELCKLQPSTMPQVLAQATEMLFERIDTMHTICIERFVNWFSYHLSMFQFRWSWDDWSVCLEQDPNNPKPRFVHEVLHKILRLSYHQRVMESVPESFHCLLPLKPQPCYKYEQEGAGSLPGTMKAHALMSAIKSKCTPEEAAQILKELPSDMSDDNDLSFNPLKIDVFVSTLLYLGSKSFSHSFAALAKFHPLLKSLAETEESQIYLLKTLYSVWKSHQQMLVVLVDKLLRTQIVECSAVANWLFSDSMKQDFISGYLWEIMHSTIKKMSKQVDKLQKEVDEGRDRLDAQRRRAADGLDMDGYDEDIPTTEMIDRMEEKLESAISQQKSLFLIIFQRFIILLTEHLARCESEGIDYNTAWYKWVIERLQQVFLQHHTLVYKYVMTLEELLFTSNIDIHILEVFQQFCSLRS